MNLPHIASWQLATGVASLNFRIGLIRVKF